MTTIRNAAMIAALVVVIGCNVYFDLANNWLAAVVALLLSGFSGVAVELFFIKKAHDEMYRLHGKDWG